jgi:hypothetical protein
LAAADFPPAGDDPEPDPELSPFPFPLLALVDFPLPLPDPDPLPDFPLPPDLLLPASDAFVLLSGVATLPDFVFDELWAG